MNMEEQTQHIELKPPASKGIVPWMKENLFSTWFNTLLTCLALVFLYLVLKGVLTWVFTEANWKVIPANLQLFTVGTYPREEIWRVWSILYLLSALAGVSASIWGGLTFRFSVGIACVLLFFAVLPFELSTRAGYFGCAALMAAAFALIRYKWAVPKGTVSDNRLRPWVLGGWVLSFPVMMITLHGFGENAIPTANWGGLLLTLILAVVGILFCFPLGVLLAIGRRSRLPALKWASTVYIETIRGVPLITILFMANLMIPIFMPDVELDKVLRAMLGITFFSAAYMAENVRGGLQAIPRGQYEAAQAVGLNYPKTMRFIVLPQALQSVIPAIVGQFIALFKDTTLVTIIGLLDLLGIAKGVLTNRKWLSLQAEVYIFAAVIYFIFCYSMSYISRRIEAALGVNID